MATVSSGRTPSYRMFGPGHAEVGNKGLAAAHNFKVCGGEHGVGAEHRRHPPVEIIGRDIFSPVASA